MFGKNKKVLKKGRKNASKKEAPKMTPKRVPGTPRIDYFGPGATFSSQNGPTKTHPEGPKSQKVRKSRDSKNDRKKH